MWSVGTTPAPAKEQEPIERQNGENPAWCYSSINPNLMWLTYLFSSEECLWVELGVSFVDGQWNDPPLAHVVPPAVTVGELSNSSLFFLPLSLTSDHGHKSLSFLPCLPFPSSSSPSLPCMLLPPCPTSLFPPVSIPHLLSLCPSSSMSSTMYLWLWEL